MNDPYNQRHNIYIYIWSPPPPGPTFSHPRRGRCHRDIYNKIMYSTQTMEKTVKNAHLSKWKLICTESKSYCKLVLFLPKFGLESQGLKPKNQKTIFPNRILKKQPWKNQKTMFSIWNHGKIVPSINYFFLFFSNYFFIVLRTNLMDANLEKIKIREQLIKDIVKKIITIRLKTKWMLVNSMVYNSKQYIKWKKNTL